MTKLTTWIRLLKQRHGRLSFRIWVQMTLVLFAVFISLLAFNNYMVRSLYQNQYKGILTSAHNALIDMQNGHSTSLSQAIATIEKKYPVFGIAVASAQSEDNFNDALRNEMAKKHLPYNRIWIVKDRMQAVAAGDTQLMSFRQDNIQQSYKALLFSMEGKTVILLTAVVDGSEWLALLNQYMPLAFLIGFVLLTVFLWRTSKRISNPLNNLTQMALQISNHNYSQVKLQTGDEFEVLAGELNRMSKSLENYYRMLNDQNEWLQSTIQNMSHEMKTPLALLYAQIAAYRDGILTEINYESLTEPVDRLNGLIEQMLLLASLQQAVYEHKSVSISELIHARTAQLTVLFEQRHLALVLEVEPNCVVIGDEAKLQLVVDNLLTNAFKYATRGEVCIHLSKERDSQHMKFRIINESLPFSEADLNRLEQPFFTKDQSRHRSLSGTGLGLSQVAAILDKHGFQHAIRYQSGFFEYEILL